MSNNQISTIPQLEEIRREAKDFLVHTQTLAQSAFQQGSNLWLESRRPYLSPRTYSDYEGYLRILTAFFGEMRLVEIGPDEIRAYQRMRMMKAGASCINKECSLLQQMLKRIGRWPEIVAQYQPLTLPKESPHSALTPIEEDRLYRIGASNPRWEVAYCAFVLSINTTAGPGEIRHVRRMDINFEKRTMRVQPEGAKNEHRIRVIPLNETAWKAVEHLWKRAEKLGSKSDHHYLIPFRKKKEPTIPSVRRRVGATRSMKCSLRRISASQRTHSATTPSPSS